MKKQTHHILRLSIFALMILSLVAIAMASPALTINTATWEASTVVNISTKTANDGSLVNMSYITVRFSATDTANSSTSRVVNITNTTATNFDLGYANFTMNSAIVLEDTSVGSATAISTGVGASDAVTSSALTILVDRTTPTAPTGMTPAASTVTSRDQTFVGTVVGAETTGCTLIFDGANPPRTTSTMTHSGDTCTLALTNIPSATYRYAIRASDGVDTADSAYTELTVDGGQMSASKKALVVSAATGQAATPAGAQKGLSILNNDGGSSGTVAKELTTKELTKTGAGALIGGGIAVVAFPPAIVPLVLLGAGFGLWL